MAAPEGAVADSTPTDSTSALQPTVMHSTVAQPTARSGPPATGDGAVGASVTSTALGSSPADATRHPAPTSKTKKQQQQQQKTKKKKKKKKKKAKKRSTKHAAPHAPKPHRPPKQRINKAFVIPGTKSPQLTMYGWSRSMSGTGFFIPELKWCLDAGHANLPNSTHIFVTHGHQDHSLCLAGAVLGCWVVHHTPATVYCPKSVTGFVTRYVKSGLELNMHSHITNESARANSCPEPYVDRELPWPWDLVGCTKDDEERVLGDHGIRMQVFECHHSVETVGFGFFTVSQRLRPEFAKLPGAEIGRLRKANTPNMFFRHKHPMFAFLGDTTTRVFDLNPDLADYPCIIIECTFLYPEHVDAAAARRHVHWDLLRPIVEAHPATTFVLIHFSNRYSDGEILAFFSDMEDKPANIVVWMPGEEEACAAVRKHARYRNPHAPTPAMPPLEPSAAGAGRGAGAGARFAT